MLTVLVWNVDEAKGPRMGKSDLICRPFRAWDLLGSVFPGCDPELYYHGPFGAFGAAQLTFSA